MAVNDERTSALSQLWKLWIRLWDLVKGREYSIETISTLFLSLVDEKTGKENRMAKDILALISGRTTVVPKATVLTHRLTFRNIIEEEEIEGRVAEDVGHPVEIVEWHETDRTHSEGAVPCQGVLSMAPQCTIEVEVRYRRKDE